MRIHQLPVFYLCRICGRTTLKKVRRLDTLPIDVVPTLEDVETLVEIGCCSKCGRDVYPVFTVPKRWMIFPGTRISLVHDIENECYYAFPKKKGTLA